MLRTGKEQPMRKSQNQTSFMRFLANERVENAKLGDQRLASRALTKEAGRKYEKCHQKTRNFG